MKTFSRRFKLIVLAGLVLNVLHGVEVSQTKFFVSNPDFYPWTKFFENIPEAVYYVQHAGLYLITFMILCFVLGGRWVYIPLYFLGALFVLEIHHVIRGIFAWEYVSGLITSALFIPLAALYIRELVKHFSDLDY